MKRPIRCGGCPDIPSVNGLESITCKLEETEDDLSHIAKKLPTNPVVAVRLNKAHSNVMRN